MTQKQHQQQRLNFIKDTYPDKIRALLLEVKEMQQTLDDALEELAKLDMKVKNSERFTCSS